MNVSETNEVRLFNVRIHISKIGTVEETEKEKTYTWGNSAKTIFQTI